MHASVIETPYLSPALPSEAEGTCWFPAQHVNIYLNLEPSQSLFLTFIDMRLNHHAHNAIIALRALIRQYPCNLRLVLMVLLTISMGTIDHQSVTQSLRPQLNCRISNALLVVIRATRTTTHDHKAVLIPYSTNDRDDTLYSSKASGGGYARRLNAVAIFREPAVPAGTGARGRVGMKGAAGHKAERLNACVLVDEPARAGYDAGCSMCRRG